MGVVEVLDPVAPTRAGGWKVDVSRGERNGRVSSEWFNRPDDERYLSLDDLWASVKGRSERSRCRVVQTADIRVAAAHTAPSGCFGKVVSMIRPAALGRARRSSPACAELAPWCGPKGRFEPILPDAANCVMTGLKISRFRVAQSQ
jgi:hypothetical protein